MNPRVTRALTFVKGTRILDIGCWNGDTTKAIADKTNAQVIGVDILPEAVEKARKNYPELSFEVRDISRQPYPRESFDCIVCLEVIEHIENPSEYLKTFYDMLTPDGLLVLSTPNANAFNAPLKYLRDLNAKIRAIDCEEQGTGSHLDHIYSWDLFTLYRLLHRNGFKYEGHAFSNAAIGNFNLDYLTPLLGRFCTSIIISVRKNNKGIQK